MENAKFPIVLKKKNGVMIGVAIIEIIIGIIFGALQGGLKSAPMWVLFFAGIVTALSVFVEYSQDILIKEDAIEFYRNNDLIKSIKYSNIKAILIGKGNEPKNKRKDFFVISFYKNDKKKNKNSAEDTYLINPMSYSAEDFKVIKNIIVSKNSSVKVSEDVSKFIK
ncbi:hypothetical protein [Clostridium beijerinckii]|uniref:hypothetical protein n=1 Tax=Clostridium beijerinckii TaxID=1520 RepID=UPI00080A0A48|nr:hypothetical protein [Clostridium beijerinckii]OCA99259.1 hypothetical protein BGS1_18645 [Clostridium beijerinckii]